MITRDQLILSGVSPGVTFQDLRITALTELGSKSATNAEIVSFSGHTVNSPILQEYVMQTKETALNASRKMDGKNFGESDLVSFAHIGVRQMVRQVRQNGGSDGTRTRGLRRDRLEKSEE